MVYHIAFIIVQMYVYNYFDSYTRHDQVFQGYVIIYVMHVRTYVRRSYQ